MKQLYKKLIKNGWTLNGIDEMDIHFYFDLHNEDSEQQVYIDELNLV